MNVSIENIVGEEREGFYVQPLMKRAWAAQLEVLKGIEAICKRHNLRYFAQWGTLLGAVRHGGFIPWDDDMDIAMLREDYEQFKVYARTELPEGWRLYTSQDEGFDELMMRVVNSTSISLQQDFLKQFHGCPYPMGVDIFCMDHIPKKKEEEQILLNLLSVIDVLGVHWNEYSLDYEGAMELVQEIEELTGYTFDKERPMKKQLLYLAEKVSAMYWDAESDVVTFTHMLIDHPNYRFPIEGFDKMIDMPFENTTIPVPECYDLLLKANYGPNYMVPVKKWNTHTYPFFRNQVERLRKFFEDQGHTLPEVFDIKVEEDTE